MKDVEFVGLDRVDPEALLALMNEEALRKHLVDHPYFDASSISEWVEEKRTLDALPGCPVAGFGRSVWTVAWRDGVAFNRMMTGSNWRLFFPDMPGGWE